MGRDRGYGRPLAALCVALVAACGQSSSASMKPPLPRAGTSLSTTTASVSVGSPCTDASIVGSWPLARRAAQLVVIPALDGQIDPLANSIAAGVGGVILIGGEPPADLARQITAANQKTSPPPLVMADEEGGGIQRLANLVGSLPWPRQMAATMTPEEVRVAVQRVAARMRALGVTMDLAPVLDVDGGDGPNSHNPDGQRSLSSDPATAGRYGVAFADGLRQGGVIAAIKHFPGLGGSSPNTDYGPADTQPISILRTQALPPFQAAISAGASAVMVANATVPGLTTGPASLSPEAIDTLLRRQLGFAGLVMTDSLSADAISAAGFSVPQAAVAAVKAGDDMVLFGSTLTAAETALLSPANVSATTAAVITALVTAARSGELPASRLDRAALNVLATKGVQLCSR